ncbi:TRAP transporter large permease [Neobacillus niacini]|uniref:TRAP transporter large permease n=1 Tax=Neobacillus niacini TaxID=86668 RepID=UPI00204198E6|nr:TRAP transporter large permease [Neobacillus niacini]MCM3691074.1 TRAP transporter large permease [Neobacillus niacini]
MVALTIVLLLVLLFIGMPIGFVLLVVGSIGLYLTAGFDSLQGILATTAYRGVNNYTYSAIPLFILMAHLLSKSKIADDLFESVLKWMGHLPGGAGVATVIGSAGFGALSGSSTAATSVMSQIAIPQMVKAKSSPAFAAGLVATTTGTLAALIPPSIPLILYGIQTETSVGQLFIAGILPGILLTVLLVITVVIVGIKQKSISEKFSWNERLKSLKSIWPAVLLILIVISVVYFGVATPTEAAAFGVIGALVIGLSLKRLKYKQIVDSLFSTVKSTAMIFVIIVGANVFAYYITLTRVGFKIISSIEASGFSPWMIFFLIVIMYLILGMFMDMFGSMLLTLPLVYPLMVSLGFDTIWFGIILVLLLEIGLVTPPVGINLYITSDNSGVPVKDVLKGSLPFIGVLLLTILILVFFPQIALFLPSKM